MVEKLGELLLDYDKIDKKQLQEALKKQQESEKRLGQLLVDMGYISEKELVGVLEYQLGIPRINLESYNLNPALANYIPENIARRYDAAPVVRENDKLKVAMVDPTDIVAIDDMEMHSELKIEPLIATKT